MASKKNAARLGAGMEVLEGRDLMAASLTASLLPNGTLRVEGTERSDQILVRQINGRVAVDNTRLNVSAAAVRRIEVQALGGNDTVRLDRGPGEQLITVPTLVFGGAGNDALHGGGGRDELQGGAGNDSLFGGGGNDLLFGQDGVDLLRGQDGNDELQGGNGDDELFGGAGNDNLFGQAGSDWLFGEAGADLLDGGAGLDFGFGGAGADRFVNLNEPAFFFVPPRSPITGERAGTSGVQDFRAADGDRR